jgi:hypothetical protein
LPSIDKARRWYDDYDTVRKILTSIGLWPFLITLLTSVGVFVWSHLKNFTGPASFVLGLATLATGLVIAKFAPDVIRRSVKVKLVPAVGPAAIQLLEVRNCGPTMGFRAECTLLRRRNDPNQLHRASFRMEWQGPYKRSLKIRRGASFNLIVARAYNEHDMDIMEICGLSEDNQREAKESSRWNHGDKLPEYDLRIRIIGEDHRPHVECFTVKAGRTSALEMISIPCK